MVNHGIEPVKSWWKGRTFAALAVPEWMKGLLSNSQPILLALEEKIRARSRSNSRRRPLQGNHADLG